MRNCGPRGLSLAQGQNRPTRPTDSSLFLALLLLLLVLLHDGVGREGEDVQSSQEDHQGVNIEKSWEKHLLQKAGVSDSKFECSSGFKSFARAATLYLGASRVSYFGPSSLVCAVRAVGCVAGGNEPSKATELAVDGIPVHTHIDRILQTHTQATTMHA